MAKRSVLKTGSCLKGIGWLGGSRREPKTGSCEGRPGEAKAQGQIAGQAIPVSFERAVEAAAQTIEPPGVRSGFKPLGVYLTVISPRWGASLPEVSRLPRSEVWIGCGSMLAIVVNLEIKPATEEQAIAALEANAAGSRQEPGCLKWEWSRKLDEPTHFAIYELYRDQAAIDAHRSSPHFLRWDQSLPGFMASKSSGIFDVAGFDPRPVRID